MLCERTFTPITQQGQKTKRGIAVETFSYRWKNAAIPLWFVIF